MHQKTDLPFQEILKRAREGKLNLQNVRTLNQRPVIDIPTIGTMDTVNIIQKNKTCHFINQLQSEKYACANNRDIIIFPVKYYQMKKDGGNLI